MAATKNKEMIKQISLWIMAIFYIMAGFNHFIHPASYYVLIPPYLPFPAFINILSGTAEIVFGTLLVPLATRKIGAIGITILLVCFIPTHIYMIQKGGCMSPTACFPAWIAWVRLFPLQFILIAWARWYIK